MLTVGEARAVITTSLDDSDLGDVIEREEAWLARRVGPLDGERVETFITSDGDEVLRLTRHTASVTVEDADGSYTGSALRGWSDVVPSSSDAWRTDVSVTYTPDDDAEVKRAVITLVRLAVNESAYSAEAAGGFSASTDHHAQKDMRYTAWRSLLRPRVPETTRVKSAIPSGGKTVGSVATEASGS